MQLLCTLNTLRAGSIDTGLAALLVLLLSDLLLATELRDALAFVAGLALARPTRLGFGRLSLARIDSSLQPFLLRHDVQNQSKPEKQNQDGPFSLLQNI